MPNRYIRESAIESEPVNSLSWAAEVFYRRLLNRVDDFGRFSANPSMLRAMLFPLQISKVSEGDVAKCLTECCKAGLVFRYEADGKCLLVVNKWEKGRAAKSRYAEPPADICKRMKTFVYRCKHKFTDAPDSDSDTDSDTDSDIAPVPVAGGDEAPAADCPFPREVAKKPDAKFRAESSEIPSTLATPEFVAAWADWCAYKRERGQTLRSRTAKAQLAEMNGWGESVAIAAIRKSIVNGWTGVFQPDANSARGKPVEKLEARFDIF